MSKIVKVNAQFPEQIRDTLRDIAKEDGSSVQGVLLVATQIGLDHLAEMPRATRKRLLPTNGHLKTTK